MAKGGGKDSDPEREIFLRRKDSSRGTLQDRISKEGTRPNRAKGDSRKVAFLARKAKTSFQQSVCI